LDELDKMKESERKELNTAMEQQIAMYHKNPFDIETKINASIVGAANPNSDVWIDDRSTMDNMKPLETTIVSRCIMIKVNSGTNTNSRLSHVIDRMKGLVVEKDTSKMLTHEELSGLLTHCRELNPVLTKQASDKYIQFMTEFEKVEQNELADLPIDARKELDLLRVSTAIAKLLLRDEVNIECINIAIKFYEECLASVGLDTTNPILQTNVRGEFENKTEEFYAICRKLQSESPDDAFTEAEILTALGASEHWPTRDAAGLFWDRMRKSNMFYEPKAGFYRRVK
jgi:DNA replicative helicase MCM subunit Mcm2 (Cdc46/Mcm family)